MHFKIVFVLSLFAKSFVFLTDSFDLKMAFNQFMHPRNIYRNKPCYQDLTKFSSDFAKHCSFDSNGKLLFDYSNPNALRSLTKVLLIKDFGLDVEIPEDRLIPTLPMRLNYVLWIEDLLDYCGIRSNNSVSGVDIGTGCCAIFPLLSATLNKNFHFLATDIDAVNLSYAKLNVDKNGLSDRVTSK